MATNGKALTAMGVGVIFVWSGIRGFSVLGTLRDIVAGKKPVGVDIAGVSGTPLANIAATAMEYVGHAYQMGGAPGKDAANPWDCSSFTNFVVAVRSGLAIPGYKAGTYDGSVHGPTTVQWAAWSGIDRGDRAGVQAGDIIIWLGHMGIAVDNTHMISALNPKDKTMVTVIDDFGSKPLVFGRLNGGILS